MYKNLKPHCQTCPVELGSRLYEKTAFRTPKTEVDLNTGSTYKLENTDHVKFNVIFNFLKCEIALSVLISLKKISNLHVWHGL